MERGTILRRLRRHLDYSQEYVADEIGISQKQVCRVETGKAIPRINVLERWCKVVQTTIGEFDRMCEKEGATWGKDEEA